MKRFTLMIITLLCSCVGFSQNAAITLSSLKVTDVVDSSAGEMNKFFIEFSVTDPKSLGRIEIRMESNLNPSNNLLVIIPVTTKDNITQMEFEKFSQPISGNIAQIMQNVKDQFKEPYQRILVKGYDLNGKETNQLIFERLR